MFVKKLLSALVLAAAFTGIAQAHTHLEMAMPADNAVLADPPASLMLHFSEATRLTALSLQKEGEKQAKPVASLPKEASKAIAVPLQPLAPGKYTVNWRVVGSDNHVMNGALKFTVQPK
ncbi:copper resistance CopC family protein [Steroidobacter sp.]|uniref:copper resistance CopC family protein n=1 Tax=Steroidobacter sp. TaxID=1978227 RepID=UPI001A4B701A|nr:copper resistance CopC family protein [Steroidobacter sp.]MBL8265694.1 copper resistance protein CopC [Steroidobacter sp.]